MEEALAQFLDHYQQLDRRNLHLLDAMYSPDVRFIDPAHQLEGLVALHHYFESLYDNVEAVHFRYQSAEVVGNKAWVQWTLALCHPRLNGGHRFEFDGVSQLLFDKDGKVSLHRDYFDLGAMLYERLPLLGPLVRWVKGRLAQ